MTNLTVSIDEEVLKRARIRAIEEGTSVNAVVRAHLESYAGVEAERRRILRVLLGTAAKGPKRRFRRPKSRDEIHER
jgi:plasmid stability protein